MTLVKLVICAWVEPWKWSSDAAPRRCLSNRVEHAILHKAFKERQQRMTSQLFCLFCLKYRSSNFPFCHWIAQEDHIAIIRVLSLPDLNSLLSLSNLIAVFCFSLLIHNLLRPPTHSSSSFPLLPRLHCVYPHSWAYMRRANTFITLP